MSKDNFFKGTKVRDIATALPPYTNGLGSVWNKEKREWESVTKFVKDWVLKRLNSKKPLKSIDQIADEAWLSPVSFEVFETNEGLQYLVPTSKDKPVSTDRLYRFNIDIPPLPSLREALKKSQQKEAADLQILIYSMNMSIGMEKRLHPNCSPIPN